MVRILVAVEDVLWQLGQAPRFLYEHPPITEGVIQEDFQVMQ